MADKKKRTSAMKHGVVFVKKMGPMTLASDPDPVSMPM